MPCCHVLKMRFGFEFWGLPQHFLGLWPNQCEWILSGFPRVRRAPLFGDAFLAQIFARGVTGHACFHGTHTYGSSLIALDNESDDFGASDLNPKQHTPSHIAQPDSTRLRTKISPTQGLILIVVSAQL